MSVSGHVPPGATRAVVIDDRGDEHEATIIDGTWSAAVRSFDLLVRFTDAAGGLVARPLPDGPRARVDDAPEPCPVCATVAWVMIGDAVFCERCGHLVGSAYEESHGGGSQMTLQLGGSEALDGLSGGAEEAEDVELGPAFQFDAEAYLRALEEALAAVRFPVYAVPGRARSAGGRSDGTGDVVVDHDTDDVDDDDAELSVATGPRGEAHLQGEPRDVLSSMLDERVRDHGRSLGAKLVVFAHSERSTRRRAARAEPAEGTLVIDGTPEPFVFLASGDAWVATREHGDLQIMVGARAIDPDDITLEPLADPANAAAGTISDVRRAAERARRDAAGELLTRAEVEQLIDRHDLTEHRDKVLAAIRPGYRLLPGDAPRTRIGGLPDLAPGEQWPHDEDGIPFTFVAQVDCSALPPMVTEFPLPEWGHGGALVRIFAALDARVPEPGPVVALACPPDAPVARAELPPRPDPMPADAWEPDDESLRMLHELPVRLVPFLDAQVGWYAGIPSDASDDYHEFARRLAAGGDTPPGRDWDIPQLLGHGSTLQGEDPTTTGEFIHPDIPRAEWRTLLNITDHVDMSFGDGGGLAIVIPRADLAAGRYGRLVTDLSMG